MQRVVVDVRAKLDAIAMTSAAAQRLEIQPWRASAILTDDFQPCVGHALGDVVEGLDQPVDTPASEYRTHEQDDWITPGPGIREPGSGRSINTQRYDSHA